VEVFLNSAVSAVFGDNIVLCVNNTEDVQYKVNVYLNITNQNKFFRTSSILG